MREVPARGDMDSGETFRPQSDDAQLDALFQAYRAAYPDPEPGPDFMPRLWQKIEARERVSGLFGRLARHVATAAVALSLLMGLAVSVLGTRSDGLDESY